MPVSKPTTIGSKGFDPDHLFDDDSRVDQTHEFLKANDLASAIQVAFTIPPTDQYTYHAGASVTLAIVQQAVTVGRTHGLHDWYLDATGQPSSYPDATDIIAYISLFDPTKSSSNTLKGIKSNAKKNSIRAGVADYLISKRYLDPALTVSKRKQPHANPYVDFWAWSCHSLEYAGPNESTVKVKMSHHVLPVFMHHFGCSCPSYEALEIIKKVTEGKTILDIGSGNGYWTLMLRRHGCEVIAVDSGQSSWRTYWIPDTINTDGVQFVKKRAASRTAEDALLMVYPIVSDDFTKKIVTAYKGDVIAIVGTQNGNGYTGFKDQLVDEWMQREKPKHQKIAQLPLPSFAGKDDALFIFRQKQ